MKITHILEGRRRMKFKEPFHERVVSAVEGAVGIAWDGCHKIYIAKDNVSFNRLRSNGYMTLPAKDDLVETLRQWFDVSCPLRFITAVEGRDYTDAISQFEYDDIDDEGEEE